MVTTVEVVKAVLVLVTTAVVDTVVETVWIEVRPGTVVVVVLVGTSCDKMGVQKLCSHSAWMICAPCWAYWTGHWGAPPPEP